MGVAELLECATEESFDVSLNFGMADLPARFGQGGILVDQYPRDHPPRVLPLVNDLIKNPRVRVLGSKAQAKQLESETADFFNQVRNIHEPPATENMQVTELAREDA